MSDHNALVRENVNVVDFPSLRAEQIEELLELRDELRLAERITHAKLDPEQIQHKLRHGLGTCVKSHIFGIKSDPFLLETFNESSRLAVVIGAPCRTP